MTASKTEGMKVAVIGNGNVGSHFYKWLRECNQDVSIFSGRNLDDATADEIRRSDFDLIIISVKDDKIGNIAAKFVNHDATIVHTSGSVDMSVFESGRIGRYGVLYPMQTFSKGLNMKYGDIPLYIEGSSDDVEKELLSLAHLMSGNVSLADSRQRRQLHIAAVFACNFANHLWALSDLYLKDNGLDFRCMLPLISRTVEKLRDTDPADCQTGPASRGDIGIMESQMRMLEDYPEMKAIYGIMSESIMKLCQR
ncbi:MAG: DUF2520 domain-containing protein [Muribaculaceae bacterium]|nr:DUF2520 domain-containing protein [Muribaculaceae bacterium]